MKIPVNIPKSKKSTTSSSYVKVTRPYKKRDSFQGSQLLPSTDYSLAEGYLENYDAGSHSSLGYDENNLDESGHDIELLKSLLIDMTNEV